MEDHQQAIQRTKELRDKIDNFKDRIMHDDMCKICYADMKSKTILKCCGNAYCFGCINKWFMHQPKCPMCNTTVNLLHDMLIVNNTGELTDESGEEVKYDKVQNVMRILEELDVKNKGNVLVFSNSHRYYDTTLFDQLKEKYIEYAFVKGNKYIVNQKVNDFKNGKIRILFTSINMFAYGINLENTTDIILMHNDLNKDIKDQVIGRAQRIGRTEPLRVWNLIYED